MVDLKLREQIARYVDEKIGAEDLEAWVSAEGWELDDESPATRDLAMEVMRLTSEFANGDWTNDELRERLGALSRTYWFGQAPKTAILGTTSLVIRRGQWSASTDRSLATESA